MKKRIFSLCLTLLLICGMTLSVRAESYQGASGWRVVFTNNKKMESNFKTSDMDDSISGLQPGDDIVFTIKLQNENSTATDWWMTNEVLQSMEDKSANSATGGGAYGYVLQYTDKKGDVVTLFDSDSVGGEGNITSAGEGLHAATDALEEYFYLDTLATGESGTITLKVSLDGETQGNDYQDTLAELQMNFAVELNPDVNSPRRFVETVSGSDSRTTTTTNREDNSASIRIRDIVRTEDQTNLTPYFIAMAVSGVLILILGICSMKKSKKDKKEAE